jgi:hypothetical protein
MPFAKTLPIINPLFLVATVYLFYYSSAQAIYSCGKLGHISYQKHCGRSAYPAFAIYPSLERSQILPRAAEGFQEIFMPGEPEWRTYEERTRKGVPLPEKTADNLRQLGERFDIKLPLI